MTTVRWCGHLVSLRGARGGETVFDVPVDGGWRVAQPTSELGICQMQRCFSSTLAYACSQCLGCFRVRFEPKGTAVFVFVCCEDLTLTLESNTFANGFAVARGSTAHGAR